MQISIAQKLSGSPFFLSQYGYIVFIEGWVFIGGSALYSKSLRKTMDFSTIPIQNLGAFLLKLARDSFGG